MLAEIITIGDELLIGQVVDTNSAWMAHELNKVGVEVVRIVSVRDRADEIAEAIKSAMQRQKLVLMTGGLGPTRDDLTKQVLCDVFHTTLVFNDSVYQHVQQLLAGRAVMNHLNSGQAYVPEVATIWQNRVGTAPILCFELEESRLICMPGVPQEMKVAIQEHVIPYIKQHFISDHILHRTFMVQNYPESLLAQHLEEWETGLPSCLKLAYLPVPGLVRLRLTARGSHLQELTTRLDEESAKLKLLLQNDMFDEKSESIEELIGQNLKARRLTVSTAESCTGGQIAAKLTSIPGASAYFTGSIVAYSNAVKQEQLFVSAKILADYGAVSEQTVTAMVKGVMKALHTDCAIATSGIAGPDGGTPEKPVGHVWIAVAYGDKVVTHLQTTDRGREMNVERAVNTALLLLNHLISNGSM